ncbi:hypothetical protein AQUSIP_24110 [Aquicella siphonis]|uniref:Flagella basal body P-ring formation protein FlgA n=1 Tax=Aquicella siphonis TaxID=254247 RepID=A0A5E4PJE2_9COXI|nr:flagellar basal body P-ring formation chaperone FlgA [Aquicella siphonis]VVC77084.1 hypothetical protein AQUSIP_24110 [Aquicella siphonis]
MLFKFEIRRVTGFVFLAIMLSCAQLSFSAGYESQERLKSAARTFILTNIQTGPGESIEVQVNQSNTPLQVSACAREIEAAFPQNTNSEQITAVELSCGSPQPWRIYVPVDVQIFSKVIIAKRTIPARDTITEDDIGFSVYNKNRLYSGFFTAKEDVIGNEAAHLITAGSILTKKNLQIPLLVHRNQVINLIAQKNAVIVTMQGIAKSDGALNATIKVFNPSSKRTLDAVVIGPNKAQVSA